MSKSLFIVVIVLFALVACTKKSVPTAEKKTGSKEKEVVVDGAAVFSQNCARCHGANGTEGRAPNLTRDEFTKDEVMDRVENGAGRMPSFSTKLSVKEIDAVAEFVAHLKK